MEDVVPGIYVHFKGGRYEVISTAVHSETNEEFVIYRSLNGDATIWIRPKDMFFELVQYQGRSTPRFQLVKPASQAGFRSSLSLQIESSF